MMLRSGNGAWRRLPLDRALLVGCRRYPGSAAAFSTRAAPSRPNNNKNAADEEALTDAEKIHPQSFVKAKLNPGEWDPNRTDPYFKPKPHRQSNLISAEDFANRPPVGFDGEFSTYQDAMISLSWMDQKTCRAIYDAYVNLVVLSQQNHQATSHEYVTRLIAEKYQITTTRAAGIIQLQHAEEQMQQHSPELLCQEQAKYAEETILQNIRDAYKSERLPLPGGNNPRNSIPFVEDPVGIHGRGEPDETSTQWSPADDIYDMEQKLTQANVRDSERAEILIDNHMYRVDMDEDEELVKTDGTSKKLVQAKETLQKEMEANAAPAAAKATTIPYPATNAKGERRDRWKYVAQIVNTRTLKRKQHQWGHRKVPTTSYTNNKLGNTLVEQDGTLRIATVAEAKQAAWKPTRTRSNEYLFQGAKKAWLEKTLKGKSEVWGKAPRTRASDSIVAAAASDSPASEDAPPAPADEAKEDTVVTAEDDATNEDPVKAAEEENDEIKADAGASGEEMEEPASSSSSSSAEEAVENEDAAAKPDEEVKDDKPDPKSD
jgi:hypothetical protein